MIPMIKHLIARYSKIITHTICPLGAFMTQQHSLGTRPPQFTALLTALVDVVTVSVTNCCTSKYVLLSKTASLGPQVCSSVRWPFYWSLCESFFWSFCWSFDGWFWGWSEKRADGLSPSRIIREPPEPPPPHRLPSEEGSAAAAPCRRF
eukprot:2476958-Pyramimonas_sp.AAC.1